MISPDYFARAGSSGIRTAMEREDDLVHDVYEYLSNRKYPKGASFNRKRTIRKKESTKNCHFQRRGTTLQAPSERKGKGVTIVA